MDNYTDSFLGLAEDLGFPEDGWPLLQQAMTHPAYFEGAKGNHADNQRLEFLGDAVLDLLVGDHLYQTYPQAPEGDLSKMRAFIVCEASLASAALDLGIDRALRLGHGSEVAGDRKRASVLADAYEAMLGAAYEVMGIEAVRGMIQKHFGSRMNGLTPEDYADKKSLLQEIIQAYTSQRIYYQLLDKTGPDHQPRFKSAVYCGDRLLGEGSGGSKKESEVAAATMALDNREKWLPLIK